MDTVITLSRVALTSAVSVAVLFVLTKLMGRKQMSELSVFDYTIGISIGSIAAEMATNLEEYEKPLTAMIVYAVIAIILSLLECSSFRFQKAFTGKPIILYEDGKIYNKNLRISKLTLDDFLAQCRTNGYFSLSSVKTVLLEPNGKLSVMPFEAERPLTPADMSIIPEQRNIPVNVIMNGKIINNNLTDSGHDEKWLYDTLRAQKINSPSQVTLATCDSDGNLSIYSKIN